MKSRKLLRIGAVVLGLALLAAACGDDDDNASTGDNGGKAKEYSLAYVGPLTGDSANLGIYIRDGAKTAVDEFNKAHTDVHITLKEFDTQGSQDQAPGQFDKYVADDSILGVVGPAFSGETKAVLPSLEEEGLVMVSASATNVELPQKPGGGEYSVFHRMLPNDKAQAAGIIKYLEKKVAPKTIMIIHDNSTYGKPLAVEQVIPQLPASIKVVGEPVAIDPKSPDFSAAVNAAKSAKPDVIFFGGYYEAAGRLMKQLRDGGVTAKFISGDGSLDAGFVQAAGPAAEGALLSCPCYFASEASPGKLGAFAKAYKALNGTVPGTYSTEAYDAANLLMTGIADGNTTRAKLLDYVEGLKDVPDAISKKIVFKSDGDIEAQGIYVFTVKDGAIVLDTATDDL